MELWIISSVIRKIGISVIVIGDVRSVCRLKVMFVYRKKIGMRKLNVIVLILFLIFFVFFCGVWVMMMC